MFKKVLLSLLVAASASVGAYGEFNQAPELIRGNDIFTTDFYSAVAGVKDGNLVMSPFNISSCLSMVYIGAHGSTAEQMRQVLGYPMIPARRLAKGFNFLNESMRSSEDSPYTLRFANAVWLSKGSELLEAYDRIIRDDYQAKVEEVDFGDTERVVGEINGWVSAQTENKIKELLSAQDIDESTRMVLVSALYLNAKWVKPFTAEATRERDFYTDATTTVEAKMMHQVGHFSYHRGDDSSLIVLPYRGDQDGTQLAMVVILPHEKDGLAAVENNFNHEWLGERLLKTDHTNVALALPKFRIESAIHAKSALEGLGMTIPFSDAANFAGINGSPSLKIDGVIHAAFIDVDEAGTEAAAATAVVMVTTCCIHVPEVTVPFRADHPFLYAIMDMETGQYLFVGRVTDPTAG